MSEIQKPQLFDQDEQKDPNFEPVLELQENMNAAEAARRLMDQSAENSSSDIEATPKPTQTKLNKFIVKTSGAALGITLLVGVGYVANEVHDGAEERSYSDETEVYTAVPGDSEIIIAEKIIGSDTKDIRDVVEHLKKNPTNAANFEDGVQTGETFIVPISINGAEPIPTVEK
jgi:hypothetical protein